MRTKTIDMNVNVFDRHITSVEGQMIFQLNLPGCQNGVKHLRIVETEILNRNHPLRLEIV